MGFYERIDTRGAWETGRPVSFVPKGALTHHPKGAVVLPAATVRSARRMRLLREPYVQCHINGCCCHCPRSWCAVHTEQNTVA